MTSLNLRQLYRRAALKADEVGASPTAEGDAFLVALLEKLSSTGCEASGLLGPIRVDVERLPARGRFGTLMVAAYALAAGVLRSRLNVSELRPFLQSHRANVRCVGLAAFSKIAEFNPSLVDESGVLALAKKLAGSDDPDDEVSLGFAAQLAGKVRGQSLGIKLIEALADGNSRARVHATHAIVYDPAMDPPVHYFSLFREWGIPQVPREPPARRLVWLLLSLRNDSEPAVVHATDYALHLVAHSWPDAGRWILHLQHSAGSVPLAELGPPEDDEVPADLGHALEIALADLSRRTGKRWELADLATLTHGVLDRSINGPRRPRGVEYALHYSQQANRRAGFLTWNPEKLDVEIREEQLGAEPIRVINAPRLFISYRWSTQNDLSMLLDHYVSVLWDRGYDIVFDRDPRHLDKQLNSADLLLLLGSCTHFVPIVTEELVTFLARPVSSPRSPLDLEWAFAKRLRDAPAPMRWLGMWCSGETLPSPLTRVQVADLRELPMDIGTLFPKCEFRVVSTSREDTRTESPILQRRELRAYVEATRRRRGVVQVEVYDVTNRGVAWA